MADLNFKEGHGENLNFFRLPRKRTAVKNSSYLYHNPVGQITPMSAIKFDVTPSLNVALNKTRLYLRVRMTTGDGANLPHAPPFGRAYTGIPSELYQVAPSQALFYSLFQNVELRVGHQLLSASTSNYSYRAYLEKILEKPSKNEFGIGLYEDINFKTDLPNFALPRLNYAIAAGEDGRAAHVTAIDALNARQDNPSLNARAGRFAEGREVVLEGKLYLDMTDQDRLLLHGTNLQLTLLPNRPQFYLMSEFGAAHHFKVDILECKLGLQYVELTPEVTLALNSALETKDSIYPIKKTQLVTRTLPAGTHSISFDNLFEELPDFLICGLVSSEAAVGSYSRDCFSFKPYNLSSITFYFNNVAVPNGGFKTRFADTLDASEFQDAYLRLLEYNTDMDITPDQFRSHKALYHFDFTQNKEKHLFTQRRDGNCRIELTFDRATNESLTLILLSKRDHIVTISLGRNVTG